MTQARGVIHTSEVNQMLVYIGEVVLHLPTVFSKENAV